MIENMLVLARADHSELIFSAVWIDSRIELEKLAEFYQLVADESAVRIKCVGNGACMPIRTCFAAQSASSLERIALFRTMRNRDGDEKRGGRRRYPIRQESRPSYSHRSIVPES